MEKAERFISVEYSNLLILTLRLLCVSGAIVWVVIPQLYIINRNILHLIFVYNIIIAIYTLFFVVRFILPEEENKSSFFCFISFLFDEVVIAYFIYNTGGSSSPFYSGYFVVITLTAFVLGIKYAVLAALFGILSFIVAQTYYGLGLYNAIELAYRAVPLIIIAFPTGLLSDALKKQIQQVATLNQRLKSKNEQLMRSLETIESMQAQLLERQREMAMLELTENIAHRLRNPIMTIGGMAELLEKNICTSGSTDRLKRYADFIKKESRKLAMLTDNLLQMSNTKLDYKFISPAKLIKEILQHYKELFKKNGISVELEIDEQAGPIRADENRLSIALKNIVENAISSMKNGGTLSIRLQKGKGENKTVEIEICDSGIGIPEEMLKNLFKPFESGGSVKKGIGLPIAKHAIEAMGGTIEVESKIGKGTTFRIILPE